MKLLISLTFALALAGHAPAATYTFRETAAASANIFASGLSDTAEAGGGIFPTEILLPEGLDRSMKVGNVTGSTHNAGGSPLWGPDGFSISVDILGVGGISGLYSGRAMALLGVFLGPEGQPDVAPQTIDFTSGTGISRNFRTLAPENGQVFLIGDGWASVSEQQVFYIPDNASRLFIGFADAGGFKGNPSTFSDNNGSLTGTFTVDVPILIPEPSVLVSVGLAVLGLAVFGRRRH